MIFFAAGDGTIIKNILSPVYQGSENASEIYLVAPFSPNLQVTVRYRLANGVWTTPDVMNPMTAQGAVNGTNGEITDETGKTFSVWSTPISGEVTRYYGTVTAQFFFYAANGAIIATSAANFPVGRGVPPVLPDTPTQDVYEQILSNFSALQEQLDNGTYTARSIYAWNSLYAYGANEIVFYPNQGEYGVFVKSLVSDNSTPPYTDGAINSTAWEEVVDFNILNGLYALEGDITQALQSAQEAASAAKQSQNNAEEFAQDAEIQANNAEQSAQNAEASAQSVKASADYLRGVQSGEIAVVKAVSDGDGNNIAEQFKTIGSCIPSTTSAENQLADKAFVNSSINNMAAFYIEYNAQGNAFPTRAALMGATQFFNAGKSRVPTQNDYAYVLSDESQPKDSLGNYPTTRYSYQGGTYPDGQWGFQYIVNNTSLTQAQVDAINSGITSEIVNSISNPPTAFSVTIPSSRWSSNRATLTASDNSVIGKLTANSNVQFTVSDTYAATAITYNVVLSSVTSGQLTFARSGTFTGSITGTIIVISF